MSMKKILMAAVAVSALTAGAASAASISAANVSGITVVDSAATPSSTPYRLASETIIGTAGLNTNTTAADNTVVGKVSAGQLGVGTYTVTFALSGPASFQTALTNGSLTSNAGTTTPTCVVAPTLVSGGAVAGTSVTYSVNLSGTCSTTASDNTKGPNLFTLSQPLNVSGLGAVTETVSFAQGGVSIDNGTSAAVTLVSNASGFIVSAAADAVATQWLLGSAGSTVYTTMTADKTIGKYTVNTAAITTQGPFVGMAGTAVQRVDHAGQALTSTAVVTGDVATLAVTVGGVATTKNTAKTTSTLAAVAAAADIAIAVLPGSPTVSQYSTASSLTVTPATASTSFTVPGPVTAAMETVSLEGTSFLAPWIGGSQSATNSIIRLSNSGVATGAVTLQLAAAVRNTGTTVGGTTCTSATLPSLASIAAGAELSILAADITTCFGNFKRGDVTITVQAASGSLTAKARNNNAATGLVSELSLGLTSGRNSPTN